MIDIRISRSSKIVLWLLAGLVVLSSLFSLYRYYYIRDFSLYIKVPCDPGMESCFISECELDDPRCTDSRLVFKVVNKKASHIDDCHIGDGECSVPVCADGEYSCEVLYCSDEAILDLELDATCDDVF